MKAPPPGFAAQAEILEVWTLGKTQDPSTSIPLTSALACSLLKQSKPLTCPF